MTGWDRLAPAYRALETLSFGPFLHRARCAWIGRLAGCRNILLLGEGNGRFLAEALRVAPDAQFTVVDGSEGMIDAAKRRIGREADRVQFIRAQLPDQIALLGDTGEKIDAVVAHFFFDCFGDDALATIVDQVTARTTPDAVWLVSEFHVPSRPAVKRLFAGATVRSLYLAFGFLTGMKVRRLPNWEKVMNQAGWHRTGARKDNPLLLLAAWWKKAEKHSGRTVARAS